MATKILFASDLHGIEPLYHELLRLVEQMTVQSVILGGDLLPLKGPFYKWAVAQDEFISSFLEPTLGSFLSRCPSVAFYLLHGNTDWGASVASLADLAEKGVIRFLHNSKYDLGNGYELIGYAHVPPTPFMMKDFERLDFRNDIIEEQKTKAYLSRGRQPFNIDLSDYLQGLKSIEEELGELPEPRDYRKAVYAMHSPPFGDKLDVIYDGRSVGSRAMRDFILENRPCLTLHGHIHESPKMSGSYVDLIGETVSVNPGQSTRVLHAVTLELERIEDTLDHTVFGRSRLSKKPEGDRRP